jgi:hypothetical protein
MRKRTIIIGGIVVVVVLSGLYVWREMNRTVEHLGKKVADYSVNATALISEYAGNETAADKKYQNKILAVNGTIKKIETADSAHIVILGDTSYLSSVRCLMDNSHADKAGSLQPGTTVTIKGAITGFKKDETGLLGSDVELNRCVVSN